MHPILILFHLVTLRCDLFVKISTSYSAPGENVTWLIFVGATFRFYWPAVYTVVTENNQMVRFEYASFLSMVSIKII